MIMDINFLNIKVHVFHIAAYVNNKIHNKFIIFQRLDGRKLLEPRPVKIYFGSNWGCCMVSLGHTR